jgi:hypothetical protein
VAFPTPVPGLVVRYSFLWCDAAARGGEEGAKDRPCAIVLVSEDRNGEKSVLVLPVTHSPPAEPDLAVEIPVETKRRLGLDHQRSWIVVTDANRFIWPGPDLRRAVRTDASSVAYGLLPRALFHQVRDKFIRAIEGRLAGVVRRTE